MTGEMSSRLMVALRWFRLTFAVCAAAMYFSIHSASAAVIVNDTWGDGTRSDPAAPAYSENGVDSDTDGDIESAWYQGGDGTLDPVATGGPLRGQFSDPGGSSSASWTTYFTPEGSEVNLANPGDQMKVTWVFTPTNVNATNGSQNMRIAVVDSPAASRLAAEGAPGSADYSGYGMFINFDQTTGRSTPFRLVERNTGSSGFLSSSSAWGTVADAPGFGDGAENYASGSEYTFTMTITHNASGLLDVDATMSGGSINGTGSVSVSATDLTPNKGSFKFDTFGLRPSGATTTAEIFDTSLFRVDFNSASVPEPISMILAGMGAMALTLVRRRGR